MDAVAEAFEEIARTARGGLPGDGLHDAEHVLRAVVDLAHEQVDALLGAFPLCDVLHGAGEADRLPALEGHIAIGSDPADRSVCPIDDAILAFQAAARHCWVDRFLAVRP